MPHDDGSFAQSAQRVLDGQLPHREFAALLGGSDVPECRILAVRREPDLASTADVHPLPRVRAVLLRDCPPIRRTPAWRFSSRRSPSRERARLPSCCSFLVPAVLLDLRDLLHDPVLRGRTGMVVVRRPLRRPRARRQDRRRLVRGRRPRQPHRRSRRLIVERTVAGSRFCSALPRHSSRWRFRTWSWVPSLTCSTVSCRSARPARRVVSQRSGRSVAWGAPSSRRCSSGTTCRERGGSSMPLRSRYSLDCF